MKCIFVALLMSLLSFGNHGGGYLLDVLSGNNGGGYKANLQGNPVAAYQMVVIGDHGGG